MIADGLFRPNGTFYCLPKKELQELEEIFLSKVLATPWPDSIKKIWEVDPLSCPRCGHEMKIISLIHEPGVIQRILRHPGLWKEQSDPHERKIKTPVDGPVVLDDFDHALA